MTREEFNKTAEEVLWSGATEFTRRWNNAGTWGNCYGDTGVIEAEPEPEWEELDKFLEKVCPGVTFLQYKLLTRLAKDEGYYGGDYYGGGYYVNKETISLDDVWDFLVERGLVEEE